MKILVPILIGSTPVLLLGAITAVWRGATSLHDNTSAIKELAKILGEFKDQMEKRVTALEQWRLTHENQHH